MRNLPPVCLMVIVLSLTLAGVSRAEDATAPVEWNGIQRLNVDLSGHAASPFLEFSVTPPSATADKPRETRESSSPHGSVVLASHETASEAALAPSNSSREAQQIQLRNSLGESLARDGQATLDGRDSLTTEALSVAKWTIITLVIGAFSVAALKQYRERTPALSGGPGIRVVETLQLGRQQGLKLVEVAGERFLVASDQGGIKAVTLLPSWPDPDQSSSAESTLHVFEEESEDHPPSERELKQCV